MGDAGNLDQSWVQYPVYVQVLERRRKQAAQNCAVRQLNRCIPSRY